MSAKNLKQWLAHPLTQGKDIDTPETTDLRRAIINSKPFLKKIYAEWYAVIQSHLSQSSVELPVLELGSGAGFLDDFVPKLITSEVFHLAGIQVVLDAQRLPFAEGSLKGVAMTNVLHHIPDASQFFSEAHRCIAPGGKIVLIEPWLTAWSRFVYRNLHHEPVDDKSKSWRIDGEGPLSRANSALPWILFCRDRSKFETVFPDLEIDLIEAYMPFRYLVSGGISLRNLMPAWSFPMWHWLETLLYLFRDHLGMFAIVTLTRKGS